MEFIEHIKLAFFVEFAAISVTVCAHILYLYTGQEFIMSTYPIMFIVVLLCCMAVSFIFMPLFEWFFDL